ncbi:MAG TPA: DUF4956 domain-containing protein [Candidatus Krumholzibacteria bacterium]
MEFLDSVFRDTTAIGGQTVYSIWQVLLTLGLTFFLSMMIAYIYRQTHRGLSYSVSFVHTMIIMGVTVSIIMMVIGTSIAAAFTLVGALSIIRFRTAVKDPRDVAFIFMTMAVGMGCGTGFYGMSLVFTLFVMPMVYFLHRFQVGAMETSEILLKVHLPENLDYHAVFNDAFYRHLADHSLLSVETIHGGTLLELVYSIHFKPDAQEGAFMDALRAINANNKVVLLSGQQNVNV